VKKVLAYMAEGLILSAIFVPFAWLMYVGGEDIIFLIIEKAFGR
jgi:hypothetical protein|tara:strand:+ start:429 stop:560 length:132 start_codon:yes stop_codon:yes gene_type:complete